MSFTGFRSMSQSAALQFDFAPASPDRWPDIETLFGSRGACGGCWCMAWRLSRAEFNKRKGSGNRNSLRTIVETGPCPGVLAYRDQQPVGWCSVAPRDVYVALSRSRIFKPVDSQPVWSISCLFVQKPMRRHGVSSLLLRAAVSFAASCGATIVEGYPQAPEQDLPDAFVWTGLESAFRKAGFTEAARRSKKRPVMRFLIPSTCPENHLN
jgi:GNAT superfamily N-acetyltransferase